MSRGRGYRIYIYFIVNEIYNLKGKFYKFSYEDGEVDFGVFLGGVDI